ncbi:MAG: 16S rRNA (guanine(527)-N(7))-methyltransferase RsmG [Candidatus Caldatribacteriota bacterium]
MLREEKDIFIQGALELGIELKEKQIDDFSKYLELITAWNQKINLTAQKTQVEIIIKHFLDSLTCLKSIKAKNLSYRCLLDVGTGPGLPGIPLKIIFPSINLFLLEAQRKKAAFLAELITQLNLLDTYLLIGRAETFGKNPEYREKYDIVVSRAVAPLNVLVEYCLPFVKLGGVLIAQKGKSYMQELKDSTEAICLLGGDLVEINKVILPILKQERFLLKIVKITHTPIKYPRREGIPRKRPL